MTLTRIPVDNSPSHQQPGCGLETATVWVGGSAEYSEYLRLSDYDSKLAGKLNYYVLGYLAGLGKKKRAAQQDIWKDLRSLAYFGICDCQRKLSNYDAAIVNCQRALTYDADDPYVHYSEMSEAEFARKNIASIDAALQGR